MLVLLVGLAWAFEPAHYARADRHTEIAKVHGDTLAILANAADRDTTSSAKQSIHENVKSWRLPLWAVIWSDSVSGKTFCDTTIFQYSTYGPFGWSTWTTIDTVFGKGTANGKEEKLTLAVSKPDKIKARAIAAADSGDFVVPHLEWRTE